MDAADLSLLVDASSAAGALIDGRIAPSTKHKYEALITTMGDFWLKEHGCALTVPVEKNAIVTFFGWLITVKYKRKPAAVSTIRLYKSALVWLYKEHELFVQPEVNQALEALMSGYERKVANLKQRKVANLKHISVGVNLQTREMAAKHTGCTSPAFHYLSFCIGRRRHSQQVRAHWL
jgi:hypothetical protein